MSAPTVDDAERILEIAGEFFDAWDLDVREDYSGRSMYGDTCVAVTGRDSDESALFLAIGYLIGAEELDEDAGRWFRRADNMGLGWVRY